MPVQELIIIATLNEIITPSLYAIHLAVRLCISSVMGCITDAVLRYIILCCGLLICVPLYLLTLQDQYIHVTPRKHRPGHQYPPYTAISGQ